MPIVPSHAERVHELLRRLRSERAAERDSAVAQLTLLGPRVIEALMASLAEAPVPARQAALEVLERLDDPRALVALRRLAQDPSQRVAVPAIHVLGDRADAGSVPTLSRLLSSSTAGRRVAAARVLGRLHGAGVVEALDPLLDRLLDEGAQAGLRLVVLEEIRRLDPPLPRSTLRPLARHLADSPDPALSARAGELTRPPGPGSRPSGDPVERLVSGAMAPAEAAELARTWSGAADAPLGRLHEALEQARGPEAIQALARMLGEIGTAASIPVLSRALARLADTVRAPEPRESRQAARAALHVALARLDSRVALHDLRDLIALRPSGVLSEALQAAAQVGDASLVPALARAASEDPSLVGMCAETYRAIATRERLRRTSAALRKVRPEHRAVLETFLTSATRRR